MNIEASYIKAKAHKININIDIIKFVVTEIRENVAEKNDTKVEF